MISESNGHESRMRRGQLGDGGCGYGCGGGGGGAVRW